ncbi:MAG: efflux RND transporter periplasmic adaptor subunit [Verrucomicrobia bacterium]|nr:efflux RND transporter periplasmic adaptor subunit [Verrucomicrobiota bacterium]NDF16577.1 efflux RND transporter periplasmic adaptor subunit [Verrucomicrobiota bacterium]
MKNFFLLFFLLAMASCKRGGGPPKDAPVPVELVAVQVGPLKETLQATGTLLAEESVDLKPEVEGEVTSIRMTEGNSVRKGDLILQIDESKQQAIVDESEADFRLSDENRKRADILLADGTISQQEHDQVHSAFRRAEAALNLARKRLTEYTLTAPFDGILGRRYVSIGQYVSSQTVLVSLYALDRMKLDFSVPERYSARVKPGQTLQLTVAAHGEEKFSGEIYLVEPRVDVETRTVQVRAYVPNPDHDLKPGMFANVMLSVGSREAALTIPEDCIFPQAGGFAVYRDAGGVAELVAVETGLRIPGRVEILSGLKAGDLVARSGNLRLSPGRKLLPQPSSP